MHSDKTKNQNHRMGLDGMFQTIVHHRSATHSTRTVAGVLALHVAAFWGLSQMPLALRTVVATHPAITLEPSRDAGSGDPSSPAPLKLQLPKVWSP